MIYGPLWIQLWNLKMNWCSKEAIKCILQEFGKVLEVNMKGNHPSGLVELNLLDPLPRCATGFAEDGTEWVDFRYEVLPFLCRYCGRIGHAAKYCKQKGKDIQAGMVKGEEYGTWMKVDNGKGGKKFKEQTRQEQEPEFRKSAMRNEQSNQHSLEEHIMEQGQNSETVPSNQENLLIQSEMGNNFFVPSEPRPQNPGPYHPRNISQQTELQTCIIDSGVYLQLLQHYFNHPPVSYDTGFTITEMQEENPNQHEGNYRGNLHDLMMDNVAPQDNTLPALPPLPPVELPLLPMEEEVHDNFNNNLDSGITLANQPTPEFFYPMDSDRAARDYLLKRKLEKTESMEAESSLEPQLKKLCLIERVEEASPDWLPKPK